MPVPKQARSDFMRGFYHARYRIPDGGQADRVPQLQ
jgi:hypothetical protein